jgi:hypothetical protein
VAQLRPRALGSLSDSQSYGGGIPTRLHTGFATNPTVEFMLKYGHVTFITFIKCDEFTSGAVGNRAGRVDGFI